MARYSYNLSKDIGNRFFIQDHKIYRIYQVELDGCCNGIKDTEEVAILFTMALNTFVGSKAPAPGEEEV